jgi:cytochrome c oxidase assembly protein subunit 15
MVSDSKLSGFARFSVFALLYNFAVVLWGVFLRASKSGDGCGEHWLTCHGEVIPSAPAFKTVIEFSHRISTAVAGFVVLALVIWAFRKFRKGDAVRKAAAWTAFFILLEVAIGAVIVLTGNTAQNWTPARPYVMAAHLIITFGLLASLTLGAWFASGRPAFTLDVERKHLYVIAALVGGMLVVGVSGSIAALSNLLYEPSGSLGEGIRQDLSADSPLLIQLRGFHPLTSVVFGVLLIFAMRWFKKESEGAGDVRRFADAITVLVLVQFISGFVTILMHAPILMQLLHLFLADVVWMLFVLLSASFLHRKGARSGL